MLHFSVVNLARLSDRLRLLASKEIFSRYGLGNFRRGHQIEQYVVAAGYRIERGPVCLALPPLHGEGQGSLRLGDETDAGLVQPYLRAGEASGMKGAPTASSGAAQVFPLSDAPNMITMVKYFTRDNWLYLFAVVSEASALLVNFLLFAVIQHRFGVEQLSLYMIIRRSISMVLTAVLLGVPLSLVRHIGAITDRQQIARYIWMGLLVPVTCVFCLLAIGLIFPPVVSRLLLGSSNYAQFSVPMLLLVLATAMGTIVVAVSKGFHRIPLASMLYILFFTASPLVSFLTTTTLTGFLLMNSVLIIVATLVTSAYLLGFQGPQRPPLEEGKTFFSFGIKGAISEFLMMFMLWMPPFIISSYDALKISGYFSLMMSLVLVAGSPMAPIGSAMMPKAARAIHTGNRQDLRAMFRKIGWLLVVCALPICGAILLAYGTIADYLLRDVSPMGPGATMVMLTSSVPISAYYGFRNVIDVGYSPTRNTLNIAAGLVAFFLCFTIIMAFNPLAVRIAVVAGFTTAVWVLGILTTFFAYRLSMRSS